MLAVLYARTAVLVILEHLSRPESQEAQDVIAALCVEGVLAKVMRVLELCMLRGNAVPLPAGVSQTIGSAAASHANDFGCVCAVYCVLYVCMSICMSVYVCKSCMLFMQSPVCAV